MSCWFPGKLVGGMPVPDPNAIAEVVTGATEAPKMGPIPNPSVTPEDNNIHPIPSDISSATGQIGISLVLLYLRHCSGVALANSHCPVCLSYMNRAMSGIGDGFAALPVANDAEISLFIQELKDFDAIKAATPNTLAVGQTQDTVALLKVPDNASTAGVNTIAENTQLQTSMYPSTLTSVWATPEETISRAGSSAPTENSVGSSSPDASPVGLEPKECISERVASAGAPSEKNQQQTPPPSTENPQPIDPTVAAHEVGEAEVEHIGHIDSDSIDPSKPRLAGSKAGVNNHAVPPPESDAPPIDLELVAQQPVSTNNLLDGYQLHIPPPMDEDLIFASPTKVLPVEAGLANKDNKITELPGGPKDNTTELRNKNSNSPGSTGPRAGEGEEDRFSRGRGPNSENQGVDGGSATEEFEDEVTRPGDVAPRRRRKRKHKK